MPATILVRRELLGSLPLLNAAEVTNTTRLVAMELMTNTLASFHVYAKRERLVLIAEHGDFVDIDDAPAIGIYRDMIRQIANLIGWCKDAGNYQLKNILTKYYNYMSDTFNTWSLHGVDLDNYKTDSMIRDWAEHNHNLICNNSLIAYHDWVRDHFVDYAIVLDVSKFMPGGSRGSVNAQ